MEKKKKRKKEKMEEKYIFHGNTFRQNDPPIQVRLSCSRIS